MLTDYAAPGGKGTVTGGTAGVADIKMDMIKVRALHSTGIYIRADLPELPEFFSLKQLSQSDW